MSHVLAKTVVVGGVMHSAGTAVPDEVARRITAPGVWSGEPPVFTDDAVAPTPGRYDGLSHDELKAEIDARNASRSDEEKLSKKGSSADLAASLIEDDKD